MQGKTLWLSQVQMVELFGRDGTVIGRHFHNVFSEGELNEKSNVQNWHILNSDKPVTFYALDMILVVGYRVKKSSSPNRGESAWPTVS
jgi:hypothetical protein